MKRFIEKLQEFRRHQYFKLFAAIGLLLLASAAYFTVLNRSYLVVVLDDPKAIVLVDGKKIEEKEVTKKHIVRLFPGTHTLRIQSPGRAEYAQTVRLIRGLYKTITPALALIPGIVEKSSGEAKFLTASNVPDIVYYLSNQTIFRHNLKNNQRVAVTPDNLTGIEAISWSPDFKLAILQKNSGFYLYDFGRYNFVDQEEIFLGSTSEMTLPIWEPDDGRQKTEDGEWKTDRRIAYYKKTGASGLYFADLQNQNPEFVSSLNNQTINYLNWSADGQYLAGTSSNLLLLLDIFTRNVDFRIENKNITGVKFSPDSQNLIFTADQLYSVSIKGKDLIALDQTTAIEKAVFAKDDNYIIAAIRNAHASSDEIKRINIKTGAKTNYLYSSSVLLDIVRMILTQDESNLIFESRNRLYTVILQSVD